MAPFCCFSTVGRAVKNFFPSLQTPDNEPFFTFSYHTHTPTRRDIRRAWPAALNVRDTETTPVGSSMSVCSSTPHTTTTTPRPALTYTTTQQLLHNIPRRPQCFLPVLIHIESLSLPLNELLKLELLLLLGLLLLELLLLLLLHPPHRNIEVLHNNTIHRLQAQHLYV